MVKKLIQYIGLALIILALTPLLARTSVLQSVQKKVQNVYYSTDAASPEIVIAAIDEKSLEEDALGPLQKWPRTHYADVIQTLNHEGVKAIGIDVLFPDSSYLGHNDDRKLANVLGQNEDVVLAARYDYSRTGERFIETPNNTLMSADPKLGWINVLQESDGFVRQLPIFSLTRTGVVEAFSLQLARLYLDARPVDYRVAEEKFQFTNGITIPVETKRYAIKNQDVYLMNINYFARPKSYQTISFSNLLEGNFIDSMGNPVDFNGKIVLIGPTAKGLGDSYLSPVSEGVQMPGVEIHANNIQTLIEQKFLKNQNALSLWLTLIGLLIVNILIFSLLKVRYAVPIVIAEMLGMVIAGIVLYDTGLMLDVIHPLILITLSFVGTFLLRFILEQKERQFIEGAFGHYVNKSVVKQILKNPKMLELGGAKRDITVFFSDIEGFTSLSEKMKPAELVQFLNEYLEEMTSIILNHQGTLDKYEGDAIMAFWNAPLAQHDHALNACLAALEQQKKLEALRKKWSAEGRPELHVRMGLNTGTAIAGNMGSRSRFDYTVMGDNVNLGSRLEGINKQYSTSILISESTYEQVKEHLFCRELDLIRVKGKNEAVRIYELIGRKNIVTKEEEKKAAAFAEALALYRSKNFLRAKEKFEAIKDDKPSQIFAKRCDAFTKNPPEEGWGGVWTFMTK